MWFVSESNRLLLGTEEGLYIAELAKDGENFYLFKSVIIYLAMYRLNFCLTFRRKKYIFVL